MKFPSLDIDLKEYENTLYEVIKSDDCVIFFDTNILSFLYKINKSARSEFYNWIDEIQGRCFIPKWNAHEYIKKVTANRDDEYLGEIKTVSESIKSFNANIKYISMYIDDHVLQGCSYPSIDEYIKELQETQRSLQRLVNVIRPQKTIRVVRQEIKEHFENKILNSDIYTIVRDINYLGQNRYHCTLPPGFQDAKKDFNSYGDLIMWCEILNYCKDKEIKKCVLISRDVKKDFVYNVDVCGKSCKLTDVRLKDEFEICTNSDQFYVIDIERLIFIFSQNAPSKFEALAKAIQIIDISKIREHKKEENSNNGISVEDDETLNIDLNTSHINEKQEVYADVISADTEIIEASYPEQIEPPCEITVSDEALKDVDFVIDDDKSIFEIIEKLRSHTWPTQNSAIRQLEDVLKELNTSDLPQEYLNALFVLGRNIYQAACGNSFSAIHYLSNIDNNLSKYSTIIRDYIASGALFEIFFDSKGEIRSRYKYRHSSTLFELDKEKYNCAFSFLETKLLQYKDTNIVYPHYADKDAIVFNVTSHIQQFDSPFSDKEYNYIDEIKIETKVIQLKRNGNSLLPDAIELSLLVKELSQIYCLPESKVQIHYNSDINKDLKITVNGNFTSVIQSE